MSQLDPYLFFDGNCAEAMRFYEKTLGGKMEMMMKASEAPPAGVGAGDSDPDAVMHACIDVQGKRLMASDWMSDQPYRGHERLLAGAQLTDREGSAPRLRCTR